MRQNVGFRVNPNPKCWTAKYCHVHKMNVAEMRMLRWMCGHTRKDKIRNEIMRKKLGVVPIEDR